MPKLRTRVLWFSGGYFMGSRYSESTRVAISEALKAEDPCATLVNTAQDFGVIATPEEGVTRNDQCNRVKTVLSDFLNKRTQPK